MQPYRTSINSSVPRGSCMPLSSKKLLRAARGKTGSLKTKLVNALTRRQLEQHKHIANESFTGQTGPEVDHIHNQLADLLQRRVGSEMHLGDRFQGKLQRRCKPFACFDTVARLHSARYNSDEFFRILKQIN